MASTTGRARVVEEETLEPPRHPKKTATRNQELAIVVTPRNRQHATVRRSRKLYDGRLFEVWRDWVVEPARPRSRPQGGRPVLREVVEHRGSVVVVPVLPDGRVVLVRQYRYAVDEFLWELVAGRIEPGETPVRAARRELQEETGFLARQWRRVVSFYPTPGFLSEIMHLYRASRLRAGRAGPQPDESIEVRAFRPAELRRMLRRGELRDAKTLVGVLQTLRRW